MGKLEKFVKSFGAFGQKIVRGKNTFGRNMNRAEDMNELIRTLDKTHVIEEQFGPFTNAEVIALNTATQTVIPGVPGKIIVPIDMMLATLHAGGTESANRDLIISWENIALNTGWFFGSRFHGSVVANRIWTQADKTVNTGATAGSCYAKTSELVGLPITIKSTAAFNGGWSIDKSKIWYRIVDPVV